MSYAQAKTYAAGLADRLIRYDLMEFFKNVHAEYYKDIDVKFMEYFLSIAQREGEFVVHHTKLREYGVMTSEQSTHVKRKFDDLGFVENVDYLLTDVGEQVPSGTKHSKHYHLTPEAFKMCLMRAQRRADQPIDPVIYVKYYLLLEKIFGLYRDYQAAYQERLISMKDDKIDTLLKEVTEQKLLIRELLGYSKDTKERLEEVQDDLTETKETVAIAKSYLAEKSLVSTMNPADESKHHFFGATKFIDKDGSITVIFVTGQNVYVDGTIETRVSKEKHEIAISPFYNANGIDLRQNVCAEFNKRRTAVLEKVNSERKSQIDEENKQLQAEITAHNLANPSDRRKFEKMKYKRVGKKDITVKFKKLSFKYTANEYISYNDVLEIILDVNGLTQATPLP